MKDETYAFLEDVKTRKSVSRSAKNRKCGSKSKRCTLPSDYLTKKEKEAMNGEVKTWNLNEFYTWDEFKEMPKDIAAAYISTLNQKYHVSIRTISNELFHIADSTFHIHVRKNGIFPLLNTKRYLNNSSIIEEFKNAMKKDKETTSADIFIPDGMAPGYTSNGKKIEEQSNKSKTGKEALDSHSPVTRLNVTMDGIDMERISDILSWFTGKDVMVTLIVNEKIGSDDLV